MLTYVLEAVQSCEDSPIMGKILAFVGASPHQCQVFMSQNQDYIVSDIEEPIWKWRVTKMTVGDFQAQSDFTEYDPKTLKEV
jgi:hypothetical protein